MTSYGGGEACQGLHGHNYDWPRCGYDEPPHLFTGKERDSESGLDFFLARYYSSGYGRFLSSDEFTGGPVDAFSSGDPSPTGPLPYADIFDPRSLNKYTYTYNNPLNYRDSDGHCPTVLCPPDPETVEQVKKAAEVAKAAAPVAVTVVARASLMSSILYAAGPAVVVGIVFLTVGAEPTAGPANDTLTGTNQPPQPEQQNQAQPPGAQNSPQPSTNAAEHTKERPSTKDKHEAGQARKLPDKAKQKGDVPKKKFAGGPRSPGSWRTKEAERKRKETEERKKKTNGADPPA